jgi:RimJ/RimL family protein N-acetyltransferase
MQEMRMNNMLHGELVHLTADDPEVMAKKMTLWNQDAGWVRFLDSEPSRLLSEKKWQEWLEKDLEKSGSDQIFFAIKDIESEALIGFIGLFDLYKTQGDAMVAIALGEREFWGKGYGTDAMRVMLRYGFNELNLRRMGLIVFEYNPRAIRSYEKVGFSDEGRVRGAMQRDGKRWDYLFMGILRDEWLANGIMID